MYILYVEPRCPSIIQCSMFGLSDNDNDMRVARNINATIMYLRPKSCYSE